MFSGAGYSVAEKKPGKEKDCLCLLLQGEKRECQPEENKITHAVKNKRKEEKFGPWSQGEENGKEKERETKMD